MPREIDLQEFIDEIYEDSIENPDTKYVFFLGAGCSKSSGIPLANELAETWYETLKKQQSKFDKFNIAHKELVDEKDYGKLYFPVFETLFPDPLAQQRQIQSIVEDDKVSPSFGYYTLAALIQNPAFNTIITTNFDDLIQDSLIYSGHKRALVITHQDLAKFIERSNTPLISKIHGDAHMHPFNNSSDTKEIPAILKAAIQGMFNNTKLIFIGYAGNDRSIYNLLNGCSRINQVYWLNKETPKDAVLSEWWNKLETKTWVNAYDFDKIMLAIKSKFDLDEPDFKARADLLELQYKKSISEESTKLKDAKTDFDYMMLGISLYSENEYEKAIEAYQMAVEINPKFDIAFYNMANAYFENKEYDKAIDTYHKAIEINPKFELAYLEMGNAYFENKEYDKAIVAYHKVLEINPKSGSAYFYIGYSYNNKKEYDKAIDAYQKALDINPENYRASTNLGLSYGNKKEYDKAIEAYLKAIDINPKTDFAYTNIFEIMLTQNEPFDQALEDKYIEQFSKIKESFITYEMLNILKNITLNKKVDIEGWKKKYKNIELADWNFDILDKWADNIQNNKIKVLVATAIMEFKKK